MRLAGRGNDRSTASSPGGWGVSSVGRGGRRTGPGAVAGVGVAVVGLAATMGLAACERPSAGPGPLRVRAVIGEPGRQSGQFSYPRALDAANLAGLGGVLVVVDKSARVQVLRADTGRPLASWHTPEWELGKPTGLTIGPHPTTPGHTVLYVADTHYHRVLMYDLDAVARDVGTGAAFADRAPMHAFGRYGRAHGEFIYLTDVALQLNEAGGVQRLYISEYGGNDRVSVWHPTGAEPTADGPPAFACEGSFGEFGTGQGRPGEAAGVQFNRPQCVVVDGASEHLFVVDACNHRIGRFGLDGALVGWIGATDLPPVTEPLINSTPGDGPDAAPPATEHGGPFTYPYGLALLGGGLGLVTQFGGCVLSVVDLSAGTVGATLGEPGRNEGQLAAPWGVAVLGDEAFVLDSGNGRVLRIASPAGERAAQRPGGMR